MKKREKKSYVKKISISLAVIMVSGLAVPTAYGVKAMEEVSIPENDVMELQEIQTDAGVAAPQIQGAGIRWYYVKTKILTTGLFSVTSNFHQFGSGTMGLRP